MRFTETRLTGAYLIDADVFADERGFFARTFCRREFENHGLEVAVVQAAVSFNAHRGTLRGMHYQNAPHAQAKLVRCSRGVVFDVIVDLRQASPTYRQWTGVELSADSQRSLYVPAGFAHGFLATEDGSEVAYQMSGPYVPGAEAGIRWNDPAIGIEWPFMPVVLSPRDAGYPDWGSGESR